MSDILETLWARKMDPNRKGPIYATPEEWAEVKRVCTPYPTPSMSKDRSAEPHEPQDSITITILLNGGREMTITNPNFKEYKWDYGDHQQ